MGRGCGLVGERGFTMRLSGTEMALSESVVGQVLARGDTLADAERCEYFFHLSTVVNERARGVRSGKIWPSSGPGG